MVGEDDMKYSVAAVAHERGWRVVSEGGVTMTLCPRCQAARRARG